MIPASTRSRGNRRPQHGGDLVNPLDSWAVEQRSAYLYRACADAENGTIRAELFRRLAGEAEAQAAIWRAQLTARGYPAPGPFVPDARTRLVANLVQWLGPRRLRNVLAAMKVRGMAVYGAAAVGEAMQQIEAAGVLSERRHRGLAVSGNLRAAVFGVNDGLVSNAGLILGVAGATNDVRMIVLSGVAGMAAGAFAMAAGEYVSVKSQREVYDYQVALERDELTHYPEAETPELALTHSAKGVPVKQADRLAKRLVARPENTLDTLARGEPGPNARQLGSPIGAAMRSCCAFAAGALVPLAPYLLRVGPDALGWTIGLAAAGFFTVGAVLSLFTGRNGVYSGVRMLVLGAGAGAVTFTIGHLIGGGTG
jgi:vacuolar iron transporter family protein